MVIFRTATIGVGTPMGNLKTKATNTETMETSNT